MCARIRNKVQKSIVFMTEIFTYTKVANCRLYSFYIFDFFVNEILNAKIIPERVLLSNQYNPKLGLYYMDWFKNNLKSGIFRP